MYRILNHVRSTSFLVSRRLNSMNQSSTVEQQWNVDDQDHDDDSQIMNRIKSPTEYVFADSKSAKFREKNKRKQKKWTKDLEQRQIFVKTPISSVIEKAEKNIR